MTRCIFRRGAALCVAALACPWFLPPAARATVVTWAVDASGDWATAANWSSAPLLPGPAADVVLNRPAGDFLVTLSSGVQAINSLEASERLTLSGGTLTVATTAVMNNLLTVAGGRLRTATLTTGAGGSVAVTSGTFEDVTANTNLNLAADNANVTILNTFSLGGTATLGANARMIFAGNQTLAGTGTILFQNQSLNALFVTGSASSLTIGAGITIRGGGSNANLSAGIGFSNWYGGGLGTTLLNQGLIAADTAGGFMNIQAPGGTFTNAGTIAVSNGATLFVQNLTGAGNVTQINNGVLDLRGTLTQAGLGAVSRTGGTIALSGLLLGNLALTAATGNVVLSGGTIGGGTYTAAGGSAVVGVSGRLVNATIGGPLDMTRDNSVITVADNLVLDGTATLGANARFVFPGSQALTGTGTIVFQNQPISALLLSDSGSTLTIGSGITVRGGGPNASTSANIGFSNWYGGGLNQALINQGVISSDRAGGFMSIDPRGGTFTNSGTVSVAPGATLSVFNLAPSTGTLAVNNGTLNLGGTLTQAGLGNFVRTGGTVNLAGVLTGNVALSAATGSILLLGGTLSTGTVSAGDGAGVTLTPTGGVLHNVTADVPLLLTTQNAFVNLTGGNTLNRLVTLGEGGRLILPAGGTLAGNGTLTFSNAQINAILLPGSGTSLTIASGILVRGGGPNASASANVGFSNWYGGGTNLTLINNGTVSADAAGQYISLNPNGGTVTNNGTLEARNGGTFQVAALQNTGTVAVVNSTFTILAGTWNNTGTITATNSVLNLGGAFTQANLGTFVRTGGTVNLTGALSGNLSLSPVTGSWNLRGGTLTGGTYSASGGARLVITPVGGVLDNVTAQADLDLTTENSQATVSNNLTLEGTATLGATVRMLFAGSNTISGTGTIVMQNFPINGLMLPTNGASLTIGNGILVRGGGAGNASANIGFSNWHGGGSNLAIVNNGTIQTATAGLSVAINPNGGTFTSNGSLLGPGNLTFGSGNSTVNGTYALGGTTTVAGGGTLTLLTAAATAGPFTGAGTLAVGAGAALTSDGVVLGALAVAGKHILRPNGSASGTTRVVTLAIAGVPDAWTGQLDINNNALIVQPGTTNKATVIAALNNQLASGRNGGLWNGPGITSSTMIGQTNTVLALADNADLGLPVYRGVGGLDASALIIAAAHVGDATLDGKVDAFDLNRLAANWQLAAGGTWSKGDFNSDGKVDAFDLNLLAANWQYGAGGALQPLEAAMAGFPEAGALAEVPEPASLVLLAPPLLMLKRRRRCR